jgi:hypothetical protein
VYVGIIGSFISTCVRVINANSIFQENSEKYYYAVVVRLNSIMKCHKINKVIIRCAFANKLLLSPI